MNEWKVPSLVGSLAGISYVAVAGFMSLPYLVEVAIALAITIPGAYLGSKLLQANEEKK